MKITFIRWKDACAQEASEPQEPVSASPLVELLEVGFLIAETAESVSLGMEMDGDHSGRWRLHIPKVNIIERRDMDLETAFPPAKRKRKAKA